MSRRQGSGACAAPPPSHVRISTAGTTSHEATNANASPRCAASYARKSDKHDFGIDAQHALLTARARRDGYVAPGDAGFCFSDDDATGITTSGKGLDRLIACVESGEAPFERVYIKDKTRFRRFYDPRYHHYLEVHLEKYGVTVCYAEGEQSQPALADPKNPNRFGSHLQDAVGSIVASEERRRLIARVTGGMRDRVRNGFYPGARPPYGTSGWPTRIPVSSSRWCRLTRHSAETSAASASAGPRTPRVPSFRGASTTSRLAALCVAPRRR